MRGLRLKDTESFNLFLQKTCENRVLVLKSGKNTARFVPSLTITKAEIDTGFERLEACVRAL